MYPITLGGVCVLGSISVYKGRSTRWNNILDSGFGFRKQNEKVFIVVGSTLLTAQSSIFTTERLSISAVLKFFSLDRGTLNPRMGCGEKMVCGRKIHRFNVSLIVCMFLMSSQLYNAEGRKLAQIADSSETVNEEKAILRAPIGSRPPRCERRCVSCSHCEAIQVPTNPQRRNGINVFAAAAYVRGDNTSNYKPMSWKCKCGNLIFNP